MLLLSYIQTISLHELGLLFTLLSLHIYQGELVEIVKWRVLDLSPLLLKLDYQRLLIIQ